MEIQDKTAKYKGNRVNHPLSNLDSEVLRHLNYSLGHHHKTINHSYIYRAFAIAVRDRLIFNWLNTKDRLEESDNRRVYYLSLEFLIGRSFSNAIQNLELDDAARGVAHDYGVSLEELAEQEQDAGLGNGGLGRLAACFLDSCANLELPVVGYGIRYEYGMFHQHIQNGRQIEDPDHWLRNGNPWEIERPKTLVASDFTVAPHSSWTKTVSHNRFGSTPKTWLRFRSTCRFPVSKMRRSIRCDFGRLQRRTPLI